ncbi:MAG: DUF4856 domain-containing protein [Myxococcales bacterium]|nr:DUF4856 domain-containing protein [Myxococcales bacterium]
MSRTQTQLLLWPCAALLCFSLVGCGSDADEDEATKAPPATYAFDSRFGDGAGVSYSGQTHRQVLMVELGTWIGGLTAEIDGGKAMNKGDVEAGCDFYYAYDAAVGAEVVLAMTTTPGAKQTKFGQLSSKNLKGKFAGNDPVGQHKDWKKDLVGWPSQPAAEGLLRAWITELDDAAVQRSAGKAGKAPDGSDLKHVFVTEKGHDLQQLITKFLGVAVSFSQAADDYMDDSVEGKGLLADNTKPEAEGKGYTALEHAWDEAWGYFGAARDYADYTDHEIAGKSGRDGYKHGYHDTDGDGKIDLLSEKNFGHSVNAAKRDRGAPTDFTKAAFDAMVAGRHLITTAGGALSAAQLTELKSYRDAAVKAWESAIAATVVHYINEVLVDVHAMGTKDYDFYDAAKHWSELKGFALGFQFNPRSPLSAIDFAKLHKLIGAAPVLPPANAGTTAYAKKLVEARALIAKAYGFETEWLGDDKGAGGW